jgi:phosphoglycerate kinase
MKETNICWGNDYQQMPRYAGNFFTLDSFDLRGRHIYLRLDVNSPINPIDGNIMSSARFESHLETLRDLSESMVVLVAHQSRPGKNDFTSLNRHAEKLERILGRPVEFIDSLFGKEVRNRIRKMEPGDIIMLENTRFYSEEVDIDAGDIDAVESTHIVSNLVDLFDYFVIDAFPAIHRAQTSLVGFRRLKPNLAGRLIEREVSMIDRFRDSRERPKIAILAGAKIDDSIQVSSNFLRDGTVDSILVGGVVANAFLWASGFDIGRKNREFIEKNNKDHKKLIETCSKLLKSYPGKIIMPEDFVLNPMGRLFSINDHIPDDQLIADIGLESIARFSSLISEARGIFLNGPMGMYEIEEYSVGTREILEAVANSDALTIAGGGHTLSALEKLNLMGRITHASTGGGALISYLSGDPMPVLESLVESRKIFGVKEDGKQ